jgi:hypothetical protein
LCLSRKHGAFRNQDQKPDQDQGGAEKGHETRRFWGCFSHRELGNKQAAEKNAANAEACPFFEREEQQDEEQKSAQDETGNAHETSMLMQRGQDIVGKSVHVGPSTISRGEDMITMGITIPQNSKPPNRAWEGNTAYIQISRPATAAFFRKRGAGREYRSIALEAEVGMPGSFRTPAETRRALHPCLGDLLLSRAFAEESSCSEKSRLLQDCTAYDFFPIFSWTFGGNHEKLP